MRILLTNDDGFGAPGLEALYSAAEGLGERVIVAPDSALSGCSHQVTTERPLRLTQRAESKFSIDGTPADCVRVALHRVDPDVAWVLSGINAGGNLGADVYHSGTVAAAREAVLHGKPAIAVSHYKKRGLEFDWVRSAAWVRPLLLEILLKPWTEGTLWNINLPHLEAQAERPEVIWCPLDPSPLPLSFRGESETFHYNGNYHERQRRPGTDVDVCMAGRISVTEMKLF
ncbi:MAG TPA: 5'/3'-nucleotidase SurE [Planctomycetota bacterium]|nr:5'/3'-nucleotidase SurE [Planctomycetota bacterium]